MDTNRPESPVFTGFQAQKKTSGDVFRCVFGGAGGIRSQLFEYPQ